MPRPGKRGAASREQQERPVGAYLTILDGREAGKEVPIEEGLTVGRTIENGIVVSDGGVSRKHAQVRCEGGVYTLIDLGSANGTVLNDQKITGVEVLRSGDVIVVGATGMEFTAPDDSRPMIGESTRLAHVGDVDGGGPKTDPGIRPGGRRGPAMMAVIAALLLAVVGGLGFGVYKLLQNAEVIGPSDLSSEIILGSIPTTGGAWKYGLYQEIPRQILRPGGGNVVTFRQTRADPWEVGYVRIKQDPLLPPNPEEADNQIQLGRKLHEDRDVEPANLWNAMLKYRLAADLLELADPRPPSYREAVQMADRINIELNEVFQQGRFSAEREYRFGNVDEARRFVQRTLAYFPDRRDVRYRELEQYLHALETEE